MLEQRGISLFYVTLALGTGLPGSSHELADLKCPAPAFLDTLCVLWNSICVHTWAFFRDAMSEENGQDQGHHIVLASLPMT